MHFLSKKYPYFVEIYGFHSPSRTILMRYYSIGPLTRLFKTDRWNKTVIMCVLLDLSKGIAGMHKEGFVHCDIKPDNILIDYRDGVLRAVITDLGISRIAEQGILKVKEFKTVNIRGASVRYASPESLHIVRDDLADHRSVLELKSSDVYSIACIIFHCINKHSPWTFG